MKFRTEIEIKPFTAKVDHRSRIVSVGSCFAQYIAEEFHRAKFEICSNPTGVLFNPASIAAALNRYSGNESLTHNEIEFNNGRWFSYDLHSMFSNADPEALLSEANSAIERGHDALTRADWVIITLGTAWVYTLNSSGEIVANCHKQPASNFTRRRLSVEEIVTMYEELMRGIMADKQVIFTVSPVRHLGDGAEENCLSKSILKVAVAEIVERFANAHYFPAYESLNDDLRDYRFYAEDLCHPSAQAREYIREKFFGALLSESARQLLPRIEKIVYAAQHRPLDASSEAFREFCLLRIADIDTIPEIDFSQERTHFTSFL